MPQRYDFFSFNKQIPIFFIFFFDLILTHDLTSEPNKQEKISDALHEERHRRMYVELTNITENQVPVPGPHPMTHTSSLFGLQ